MTILEDDLRTALRNQAQALRVPERPALDRDVVTLHRRPGSRWLIAAACLALVVAGVLVLAQRHEDGPEPAPPVASTVPDTTAPAPTVVPVVPGTTTPAPTIPDTSSEPADVSANPFLGTWVKTDIFGGASTMVLEASLDDSVKMLVTDFVPVCSANSTMTGTGRLQPDNQLVFPAPELTCDDGSEPGTLSSAPLSEDLQNLTFVLDPATDIITDNLGSVWTRQVPPTSESTTPPSETDILNGFLAARIAGDGAQQYLNVPEEDIPLLYSPSSGAPYERGEFEPVLGIEWPYGFTAFKVRLFAGDTVIEQLFFTPEGGRPGLEYQPDGFGTDIAATAEDGQPVAVPYSFLNGEVTMQVAQPWIFSRTDRFGFGRLIPEGPGVAPTTDGGERNDWDQLFLIADPTVGASCQAGPSSSDAQALAESIRVDPELGATAPVAVNVGGTQALMIDVAIAAGASICASETIGSDLLTLLFDYEGSFSSTNGVATGRASGQLMRLYLFDAPEGSSMRTLAVAIVAPESSFERATAAAAPLVDSIEFHAS